jgi:flagellar M-ring protein FliF
MFEDVAVIDQKGNLLSTGDESPELMLAAKHRDYTRKLENDVIERINRILQPVVGDGRYKAEVSATVDFTEVERAEETFNPDLPAIRSEQTLDEQRGEMNFDGGIPGALTNQPPQEGEAPEEIDPATGLPKEKAQNGKVRRQATRNYELDRTVSYIKQQAGRLQRLSVAVVVDDKIIRAADGTTTTERWTDAELERLTVVVRGAVGFSAARGDSLNVLNSQFLAEREEFVVEDVPIWQQEMVMRWVKPLAGALIVMALLFGVLRPLLKSLATTGVKSKADEEVKEMAALEDAGLSSFDSLSNETVTLSGGDALALPSPEESYEQQVNAVKGMVAEDAGRVAQVIKSWIASDD